MLGWDANASEALFDREAALRPDQAELYVLAMPVLPILDWLRVLAPVLGTHQLVTDVGSTKQMLAEATTALYNGPGQAGYLPGHPMAGKEAGGAALAEATLFRDATWLFTPEAGKEHPLANTLRAWVRAMGAHPRDLDPVQHDRLCAWVSHLPQMLSTALAAVLEGTFAGDPDGQALVRAIGGRALRETTRLGASPYSMWRDIALTNTEPIAATLFALEQELAHLRENLRTPELREAFRAANRFREDR